MVHLSTLLKATKHCALVASLILTVGASLSRAFDVQASGVNPYWASYGNCNNWIPHGWSQTWWNSYPSDSFGSVDTVQFQWYNPATGKWYVEKYSSAMARGSTNTATANNYWGVTARGSWQEVALHSGNIGELVVQQTSGKPIWCG